jgi:serine/threonine protein kinase/tetratricopeptide (TPR) repeat protein
MAGLLTPVPTPSPDADTGELDALTGDSAEIAALGGTPVPGFQPSPATDAMTVFGATSTANAVEQAPPPVSAPGTSGADVGPLAVGQAFGERYHIIRALGIGGMGAVYQTWDAELGMAVALKVIRPEATSNPAAAREMERRFKQELVLARQVTHKNVVRIHDLGEINGIKYITMPYLEGSDLATVLKQKGKLPVAGALRIIRDIAAGLVAAHDAGIVHRDLKPANIMVVGEGAIIMDFGIARVSNGLASSQPASRGAAQDTIASSLRSVAAATMVGKVLGTVEYMAPEQAKGQPADQRADIYALGLIFSDMLLGTRQLSGADPTPLGQLMQRIEHPPAPVRTVDPAIPEAIDRLISRCLQPDPADRFQTSAELVAELDRLDEDGEPIPVKRVVGLPLVFAIGSLLVLVSSGIWWYLRPPPPPVTHDPVSVVIADFQNNTGDSSFNHALEPTLKRALETASFVSAYDRAGISSAVGVRPPEKLDEVAARELAVKQGLGVVLSGSIDRQGNGYEISVKALQTVTGSLVASAKGKASNKDEVLGAATKLMAAVRKALGDDVSESARQFAMLTLSTTSLEVVRHHAAAMEAQSNNDFEEALRRFQKAVELDPKFGIGYQGMAAAAMNLGRRQDAEEYTNEALRHVDTMTERERYNTRATRYFLSGDYMACVREYRDLVARYTSPNAESNLAACLSQLREMRKAVDEMRRAVEILPKRALYRTGLALYSSYASDFQTAEREARAIQDPGAFSVLALAFAQLGQGQLAQTKETYQKLGMIDALGASLASSGLGDLAVYEGRFSDATQILEQGAAADLASQNPDRAAAKFASLARVHLLRNQTASAVAAARKALANSQEVKIRFLAARTFVEAGQNAEARDLAAGLSKEPQAEPRAYAKIIEGNIALKDGDARGAIKVLIEANDLLDTWIGHFDLGRAYLEAGADQYTQADSEFDRCIKRRGEALALFVDEEPTYGYLPLVYYYQGRARQGMNTEGFRSSYRTYLEIRGNSTEDRLLPDVRRRAGD